MISLNLLPHKRALKISVWPKLKKKLFYPPWLPPKATRAKTARRLGITRKTLLKKLKQYQKELKK